MPICLPLKSSCRPSRARKPAPDTFKKRSALHYRRSTERKPELKNLLFLNLPWRLLLQQSVHSFARKPGRIAKEYRKPNESADKEDFEVDLSRKKDSVLYKQI
jgi:hypothetical protein